MHAKKRTELALNLGQVPVIFELQPRGLPDGSLNYGDWLIVLVGEG
jgi:hypothetical protein